MSAKNEKIMKMLDFTREDIELYLETLRDTVNKKNYVISRGSRRRNNDNFIETYNITTKKEKMILNSIEVDDFCYALRNKNSQYPDEILYVFSKSYEVNEYGDMRKIEIYIKTNLMAKNSGHRMIVVSLHERKFPISYLFK